MKEINELWEIVVLKREYHEDDFGEKYSTQTEEKHYEFSYDDCISTYVSFCEDGHICGYEKVDESITKMLKHLDVNLDLAITGEGNAILDGDIKQAENFGIVIDVLKNNMVALFTSFNIYPFNIQNRCDEYIKEFPKRILGKQAE